MISQPIPYGKQHITEADILAVTEALKSDFLTQGPLIADFENAFARYVGAKYAVAVSNGTAALHLCAMAMDVKEGQKVITSPITFSASANCVRYCGGEVVFADIDPDTYLISVEKVKELIAASPAGTYAGIIPVDFAGRSVDMETLRAVADEHGMWIIEDACHAPGAYFTSSKGEDEYCGNGKFADVAIFSFHPVKHIACGEGGMITTNSEAIYKRLLKLRTHGITRQQSDFTNPTSLALGTANADTTDYPGWYMEMQELGYNYRLTDFQAALGLSQLKRADEGLKKRREIASVYYHSFKDKQWIKGQSGYRSDHAYHLYIIETDDRIGLYNFLRQKNIFCQVHYIPVHLMPYYEQQGWKKGDFPFSEKYYSRCLSLPMYPTLTSDELTYVIDQINSYFGG